MMSCTRAAPLVASVGLGLGGRLIRQHVQSADTAAESADKRRTARCCDVWAAALLLLLVWTRFLFRAAFHWHFSSL